LQGTDFSDATSANVIKTNGVMRIIGVPGMILMIGARAFMSLSIGKISTKENQKHPMDNRMLIGIPKIADLRMFFISLIFISMNLFSFNLTRNIS
jgi:hypothetical protein